MAKVLAHDKAHRAGRLGACSSKRGAVVCKAYVTKRIKPLTVDGRATHVIGVPLHWGFTGQARKGYAQHADAGWSAISTRKRGGSRRSLVNVEPTAAPVA